MSTMSKPDLYTKVVLTVIAACLVVLCADKVQWSSPAYARDEAVDVQNLFPRGPAIAPEPEKVIAVKIVGLELPGGMPVTLTSAPTTPVTIVGVDVPSAWGPRNTLPVTFPSDVRYPSTYHRTAR